MIDLLILFILFIGIIKGMKRGFVLQLFHIVGFIAALITAILYYDDLASKLTLWVPYPEFPESEGWAIFMGNMPLEQAFYNAVAFILIFMAVKIVIQIIASMLDFVAELPVLKSLNHLLGGVLGFVENYIVLFIFIYIAALTPLVFLQNSLDNSFLAPLIIEYTPIISDQITSLWMEQVAGFFI
ncbi:CvpA family protein [Salimicrobium flavidum]|uniref:Uncharacterized membrane protein, required for colicin V production n=1 Tax=Salimicrobium flavidum TaxID=570947 RepID=A0A1N7JPG5_9BACI|nr:CvpA family protein [Salimicrobium flavidum]SIS51253.1 Uncharacterized membrane protein, required for colicin V production [Salimicrobium flavidum]